MCTGSRVERQTSPSARLQALSPAPFHFAVLLTLYPFLCLSPEQVQIELADFFCFDLEELHTWNCVLNEVSK